MAGKFTRLRYDPEAYDEHLAQTTDPLLYRLDKNFTTRCDRCYAPDKWNQKTYDDTEAERIDIDSILRGLDRSHSKSAYHQQPRRIRGSRAISRLCPKSRLDSECSRYTHPASEIKGLACKDMRFDYPLIDPQCKIFEPFAINTRLQAKDDHRAVWQEPMDQSKFLPKPKKSRRQCRLTIECDDYDYDY